MMHGSWRAAASALCLSLVLVSRSAAAQDAPPGDPSASPSAPAPVPEDAPEAEAPVFLPPALLVTRADGPSPSWWTPMRRIGVGAAGFGAMGLLVGTVLGLAANSRYQDAKARCSDGTTGCPDDALTDSASAHDLAAGATVIFIAGAAAVAAGVTLIVIGAPKDGPNVAVVAGPGAASLVGTW